MGFAIAIVLVWQRTKNDVSVRQKHHSHLPSTFLCSINACTCGGMKGILQYCGHCHWWITETRSSPQLWCWLLIFAAKWLALSQHWIPLWMTAVTLKGTKPWLTQYMLHNLVAFPRKNKYEVLKVSTWLYFKNDQLSWLRSRKRLWESRTERSSGSYSAEQMEFFFMSMNCSPSSNLRNEKSSCNKSCSGAVWGMTFRYLNKFHIWIVNLQSCRMLFN